MIHDSSHISRGTELTPDVCIVGGGLSGITVALRLLSSGLDVIMLEAGRETAAPPEHVDAVDGTSIGQPYYAFPDARPRILGGSTQYWAGWCRPLDPIDLETRAAVPNGGWPLSYDDLNPYYEEAKRLCMIEGASFDASDWSEVRPQLYGPPFAAGPVRSTVWVGSPPTKFGTAYRKQLADAERLTVVLDATVTELVTCADGVSITHVSVRTIEGNAFTVRPRLVVLAAGALETPRLLLASRQGAKQGIGNEHEVVGRYFMEHPHVVTGSLHLFERKQTTRLEVPALDGTFARGAKARLALERPKRNVKFAYTLDDRLVRARELANFAVHLRTTTPTRSPHSYRAMKLMVGNLRSWRTLAKQVRSGSLPRGLGKQLHILATHPDDVLRVLYAQLVAKPRHLELYTQSEQTPNASSRVTIDFDSRDTFGVPRICLDWRLNDIDKISVLESQRLLSKHLEEQGVGVIEHEPWLEDPEGGWGPALAGGVHHMGTARMGTDPRSSVVDARCRVHGVKNLFVADTSVMPTGGYANPLLTGAALATRTGDIILEELPRLAPKAAPGRS